MNIFDTLRNVFYWISGGERQRFLAAEDSWRSDPLLVKIYREIETQIERVCGDGKASSASRGDPSRFLEIEDLWRTGHMSRADFEGWLVDDENFRAWYIARHRSGWERHRGGLARQSESRDVLDD